MRASSGLGATSGSRRAGSGGARRTRSAGADADVQAEAGLGSAGLRDPEGAARSICLSQLDRGPRTRSQLAATMRKRFVPDDVAEGVLDRLTEVGLIDDAAYATAWVESRRSTRGLAGRALARELRDRGVADHLVQDAVSVIEPADEEETARTLARRRLRSMSGLNRETQLRRLGGYLARKGYSAGVVGRVVRSVVDDAAQEELDLVEVDEEAWSAPSGG